MEVIGKITKHLSNLNKIIWFTPRMNLFIPALYDSLVIVSTRAFRQKVKGWGLKFQSKYDKRKRTATLEKFLKDLPRRLIFHHFLVLLSLTSIEQKYGGINEL